VLASFVAPSDAVLSAVPSQNAIWLALLSVALRKILARVIKKY